MSNPSFFGAMGRALWSMENQRTLYAACVSGAASTLLAAALFVQRAWSLAPCSLCVSQRYLLLFILLAALYAGRRATAPRTAYYIARWGIAPLAAVGLVVAARNRWVMDAKGVVCGRDALEAFLNSLPWVQTWPRMFEVTGMCSDRIPDVLGLAIPTWSMLGFLGIAIMALRWPRVKS